MYGPLPVWTTARVPRGPHRRRAVAMAWGLLVAALLVGTLLGTPSRAHAQASTDATLSGLALTAPVTIPIAGDTAIPLAPSFLPAITTYAVIVFPSVDTVTVSPTTSDSAATIAYLDASNAPITDADNVKDGHQVSLSAEENTINVRVTAEDTVTTQTYTIDITRLPATDTTAPTISSAETTADGKFITVTFSEPVFVNPFVRLIQEHLRLFEISYFIRAVLDVTVAGHRDVLETTTNLSGNTLTIALTTPPIEAGQAVLLSYDNVFAVNSLGLFVDAAGNPLAFFSDRTVTNNSTVTDGITFRPGPVFSVEALTINEGESDSVMLTAKLASAPSQDVTVYLYTWPPGVASVEGPDGFAPFDTPSNPDSLLTFPSGEWNVDQDLTVSTSSDNDAFDAWALVHGFEGAPPTDYIRQNTSVHVLVEDDDAPLKIALSDAPTAEILAPTALIYLENGTTPVATLQGIDHTSVNWTLYLEDDDKDAFSISSSGVLSFRNSPDAELPGDADGDNFYQVGILAESGGLTGVAFLGVFVQSVPEPPVFTDASTTREVAENSSVGTAVGDPVKAIDDVGDTPTHSLAGTDAASFDIDAATGQISTKSGVTYDHEAKSSYSVTVEVSDGVDAAGNADTAIDDSIAVTITITDVNEAPAFPSTETGTRSVPENSAAGTNVGAAVAASDNDGDTLLYTLSGADADDFTIDGNGQIKTKAGVTYDHETTPTYLVTVNVSDGRDDNGDAETTPVVDAPVDVTITLTDVDEPPTLTGPTEATFVENTSGTVATYTARDPEGATVHWSLSGVNIDRFAINGGVITFVSPPDYETEFPSPVLYVHASDSDTDPRLTATRILVVMVKNVNEGPEITGGVSGTISYDENSLAEVGTLTAVDPEGDGLTWSADNDAFEIVDISGGSDGTRAALRFNSAQPRPDHETTDSYSVTVQVTDGSLLDSQTITVSITDLDEAETLALPPQPRVGTAYEAIFTEADETSSESFTWERSSNGTTWTCVHGVDVDNNCNTGARSYTPVDADDLNQYLRVTIDYTDSHGDQMLVAVSRNRVQPAPVSNEVPTFPNAAESRSVRENARVGATVGAPVTATDDDPGDVLVYTMSANDFFTINSSTGQILVATLGLDHEEDETHGVDVTATDPSGAFASTSVTITVEDVNEPPVAEPDTVTTDEDTETAPIDVLANDVDPDDGDTLVVTAGRPANGTATVNTDATDTDYNRITYTPNADFNGRDSFTYTVRDSGNLSATATVTVTVNAINDPPTFPAGPLTRTVPPTATAGATVGAPVTATDVDGEPLTYGLTGGNGAFEIDEHTAQITVTGSVTLEEGTDYVVTVTATDPASATATATVTITARNAPPPIISLGGGGGPSGPTPSEADFEWNVKRDIEALDSGHGSPTGMWSDGSVLWLAENGDGADDAVYAYDLATGERVEEREFELDQRNRAPRGVWSNGVTFWVADSGQDRLFAYDLATGERLPDSDIALADANHDVRGIWSDGETLWVLDSSPDALYAYDLATFELLAWYALDSGNSDPRGLWSDGVTIWVSDPSSSPRRLFAYRVPTLPDTLPQDPFELERVREEEFEELSRASNNSPRGIWSDGDVMYVADASDGKVYTYNMPDAIDARLASLSLSGIDIGDFDAGTTGYEGTIAEGVTETTVTAEAMQRRTELAIDPPDADEAVEGHQVSLTGVSEVTVTVTSQDGTRTKVYRVALERPPAELALEPGWTAIEWPGADGAALADVLPDAVVAVYAWDEAAGTWLAYFPAVADVSGLNTLTAFSTGQTYWVAVAGPATWTVAVAP